MNLIKTINQTLYEFSFGHLLPHRKHLESFTSGALPHGWKPLGEHWAPCSNGSEWQWPIDVVSAEIAKVFNLTCIHQGTSLRQQHLLVVKAATESSVIILTCSVDCSHTGVSLVSDPSCICSNDIDGVLVSFRAIL